MNNKKYFIAGGVLVLVAIAAVFFPRFEKPVEPTSGMRVRKEIYGFDPKVCPGERVIVKMTDPYMRGVVDEGTDVPTVLNYYSCAPLLRDDVVLYRFSEFDDPVFRRAVAVGGDKFDLYEVGDEGGWELVVNGKKVRGAKGETYAFGGKMPPPLKLAANQTGGRLGKDQAIIFSTFPPGDRDSGTFGLVSISDLVGKAILSSER